jgi:myo-inositol-1-phosphate synthase
MRTGVWLVGARGSVAVTSVVGAFAVRAGLADPTGCVTEIAGLPTGALPGLADLVFGGHDPATVPLVKKAETLAGAGVLPLPLVSAVREQLTAVEADIRPLPPGTTQREQADQVRRALVDFQAAHGLNRVVVVNLSSTEPVVAADPAHARLACLDAALDAGRRVLPWSSLYAYATFTAGCSYVDFTPSTGARLAALAELACRNQVPYAGNDGKTGETLLRSVLAPMFALRHLRVRSWSGINLLGGGDGARLAEPGANAAKTGSKQRVLAETLGYQPEGATRIDFVPDIGDFKTAWDLVTFTGFLGTPMRLEFTWHGCDSALAAPLVLDLARLMAAAQRTGRHGAIEQLAFFFKDPIGTPPHALSAQWTALTEFIEELGRDPIG